MSFTVSATMGTAWPPLPLAFRLGGVSRGRKARGPLLGLIAARPGAPSWGMIA